MLRTHEVAEIQYGEQLLRFDPVEHRYWLNDVELRSVTRYIGDAGYRHGYHGNGDAATFGRYVHEATAYADLDDLDVETLDPLIAVRVEAWRKFKEREGFVPDLTRRERPCFHPIYFYAGTPDAPGLRRGKPCTVEIKTGAKEKWHGLQVGGGYTPMLELHDPSYKGADSLVVYLKDDGDYDLEPVTDKRLPALFLSLVATVNGRSLYGDANGRA